MPDHLDPEREYSMPVGELGAYVGEIRELGEVAKADGRAPRVLVGIEADWLPREPGHVEGLLSSQSFDVVLGSVHFLDEWAFDDPRLMQEWDKADIDAVWERYFALLVDAAASGLYDVMAHPDLVKKFGHRPRFDPIGLYESTAAEFARSGVAIEVNTAGLRKPVGELYPGAEFLSACARAGVRATVGSDAHSPAEVGFDLAAAGHALKSAGYDRLVYFVDRQPREYYL